MVRCLQALLGLELAYLLVANLLLLGTIPAWINEQPEELKIAYDSAWTLWPGKVWVQGLRIRSAGERLRGILYARSGPLAIGLELNRSSKDWKLTNALEWFENYPQFSDGPTAKARP